jgi:hypothetical protein
MNIRVLVAGALALAVFAPAANALTITNQDKADYTLKVMPQGAKELDLAIKAGAKSDVDCKMGCTLSLNGKTQAVDGKLTKIVIKSGKFEM